MMEIRKPFDIVDVKAGINAGRLFIQIKDNHLMLGDYQTGEVVHLSDIEMKPVVHAMWEFGFTNYYCSHCGKKLRKMNKSSLPKYCERCGAQMDAKEG